MCDYPTQVRRTDRQESDPAFLKALLHGSASCAIAISREGHPLNHVAFFAYDEPAHEIVFHFSKHGFAGREIASGRAASISVHKYGKLYTAARAVDFGCEYQSAIIYGTVRILEQEEERMRGMEIFFRKFFSDVPPESYDAMTTRDARTIHVARVTIEHWLGKEHLVPEGALSSFPSPLDPVIG